jgi:hypothetical protein
LAKQTAAPKQDRRQERLVTAWTLTKADLQAIALRLNALIGVGDENNLDIVGRIIEDLNQSIVKASGNLSLWHSTNQPEYQVEEGK